MEVHCACNEGSEEQTVWYFANGTRVPVGKTVEHDQPYHKRHKHKDGVTLVVPQISERNGVGVYRCEGGSLAKSITVELLQSGICV